MSRRGAFRPRHNVGISRAEHHALVRALQLTRAALVRVSTTGQMWTIDEALQVTEPVLRAELKRLGIRYCSSCLCTEEFACSSGCSWATANCCSRCAHPARTAEPTAEHVA